MKKGKERHKEGKGSWVNKALQALRIPQYGEVHKKGKARSTTGTMGPG